MALLRRLDAFDVTFPDCSARSELKIRERKVHRDGRAAKKGVGEKRLYVGNDEKDLDKFFSFDKVKGFFIQKDDLIEYTKIIEGEYLNPTYSYGEGIKETLNLLYSYEEKLKTLKEDRLYFTFTKTFDKQNRYFLVLPKRTNDTKYMHDNYAYLREICLPRVTRILFVKYYDVESENHDIYIYMKPIYEVNGFRGKKASNIRKTNVSLPDQKHSGPRVGQEKYREQVLNIYPYCVVTNVTDPNLLIACHIKEHNRCKENEKYDRFNGLTMTPTIHSLFDLGYLTFNEKGDMILSDFFRNIDRKNLNLYDKTIRISIKQESVKYLQWHNENVFLNISRGIQVG